MIEIAQVWVQWGRSVLESLMDTGAYIAVFLVVSPLLVRFVRLIRSIISK